MQILIIDGHPDARPGRFIHALAGRTWMASTRRLAKLDREEILGIADYL